MRAVKKTLAQLKTPWPAGCGGCAIMVMGRLNWEHSEG